MAPHPLFTRVVLTSPSHPMAGPGDGGPRDGGPGDGGPGDTGPGIRALVAGGDGK